MFFLSRKEKDRQEAAHSYGDKADIRNICPFWNRDYNYNCNWQDFVSDSGSFSFFDLFFNSSNFFLIFNL